MRIGENMGVCEISGKQTDRLYKVKIEGTVMQVAEEFIRYGEFIGEVKKEAPAARKRVLSPQEAPEERICDNFAEQIRQKRESLGLTQEDFAKKINEKISVLHKIETGHVEPGINLARKIERFLKIRLVEISESASAAPPQSKSESYTLGDFIKVKK